MMYTRALVSLVLVIGSSAPHLSGRPVEGRISYGAPVPKGSMDYFVSVSIDQGNGWFDCGGSLIEPNVVVTAAHCVFSDSGELVTNAIRIRGTKVSGIGVAKPKIYNPFNNGDFTGDIALIKLDKKLGSVVVRVAPKGTKLQDTEVLVAGKGRTEREENPKELQYIIVPTMSSEEVLSLYESDSESDGDYDVLDIGDTLFEGQGRASSSGESTFTPLVPQGQNSTSLQISKMPYLKGIYENRAYEVDHFGAGDRKADSCRGDSGGPAVWPSASTWGERGKRELEEDILVGIVSYGPAIYECGDEGSFGLYTDVGYWQKWIAKTIRKDDFEKIN